MDQIDKKKLDTAIIYLQRIAEGKNPVNNSPADEDSVLNDPNVIRCMYFTKEILESVRKNDCYVGRSPRNRDKQEFPLESLQAFSYRADKPISKFVEQLNEDVDTSVYQRLSYRPITLWLRGNDFLTTEHNQETGKDVTIPTEKGLAAGITCEKRTNASGEEYYSVLYGRQIQELIVQNLALILNRKDAE